MEIIPLIYMKNKKIHLEKNGEPISLQEFSKIAEGKQKIYILDLDGIEKDKPNLCTYQRLQNFHALWVDFGPRNLGDIVDATMSGATDITIRKSLCPQLNVSEINEISENKIFINIEQGKDGFLEKADGVINFNSRENTEKDYNYSSFLKKIGTTNKIYSYESELKNRPYWEFFNVEGLLVDINKIKEFENAV